MHHKYMTGRPKYHLKGVYLAYGENEFYQISSQGKPLQIAEPEKLKTQNISKIAPQNVNDNEHLEEEMIFFGNYNPDDFQIDDSINEALFSFDENTDHIFNMFQIN